MTAEPSKPTYEREDAHRSSRNGEAEAALLREQQRRAPDLDGHANKVSELAKEVGRRLGLPEAERAVLGWAAKFHDVGKMAIPNAILQKHGPLSDDEWELMRRHTVHGERILAAIPSLARAAGIVRSSHERWDGQGYPDHLNGEEIPLAARIVFVCDAYDAIISERPYASAQDPECALEELRRCSGTQFDPRVVEAFCEVAGDRPRLVAEAAESVG